MKLLEFSFELKDETKLLTEWKLEDKDLFAPIIIFPVLFKLVYGLYYFLALVAKLVF